MTSYFPTHPGQAGGSAVTPRRIYESAFGGAKQKRLYRRCWLASSPPLPGYPSTTRVPLPHNHAMGAWVHP